MTIENARYSRRGFLRSSLAAGGALALTGTRWVEAQRTSLDPRTDMLVAQTIGVDTHNHIDVPMSAADQPGPDLDLRAEMKRSGLSAIAMTFATDYQHGDPYERFHQAMAAMDRQLERNGMKRSLSAQDVRTAHDKGQPTVIQAIEGAHFLEGKLERVKEAYGRGLRHFGLLHDSDASMPLGDVYTNPPKAGLTAFGASVIRECNRLGILIDLAHADVQTTAMALKLSARPVVVSHTGLDTRLGSDERMAQMMRPRLIGKEQARMVAGAGGAVGMWTHLSDTPLDYAENIRAMVDVVGVDHVMLGTDTKLTPSNMRFDGPPPGVGPHPTGEGPNGPLPGDRQGPSPGQMGPGGSSGPPHARMGERTNEAWAGETAGFYYVVVDAMLKVGFSAEEIGKIGGGNYLRLFAQAVG